MRDRRRRLGRIASRAVALLVFAAMINFALSPVLLKYGGTPALNPIPSATTKQVWDQHAPPEWSNTVPDQMHGAEGWATRMTVILSDSPNRIVVEAATGWPMLALKGGVAQDANGVFLKSRGVALPLGSANKLAVLFTPIWPGFAINTIFYAAILWMPFAGREWIRRRARMYLNLCPACAYPVGTSPVCSECGSPVTPKPQDAEHRI